MLRDRNKLNYNNEAETVARKENNVKPAKRSRRCLTVHDRTEEENVVATTSKGPSCNASSRKRRCFSIDDRGNGNQKESKKNKDDGSDETSKLIALSCTLTNEVLNLKKSLLDKCNDFTMMQKKYYEKQIECLELQKLLMKEKMTNDVLKKKVDNLIEEKFCDDLIQLDDAGRSKGTSIILHLTFFIFISYL